MTDTALDTAHREMQAAPDDAAPRLRYFGALTASELMLLLETEPQGDRITPALFDTENGPLALAFDREDRLSAFTGAPAPYAALPGRMLAAMLAAEGLGLGVNFGIASAELLDAAAVGWWAATLTEDTAPMTVQAEALRPPQTASADLLAALHARLGAVAGLAETAWLADLQEAGGDIRPLIVFCNAVSGAEQAIGRMVADAVRFCGDETGRLDIAFLARDDAVMDTVSRHGLRIDLPALTPDAVIALPDPDAPPKLR